MNYYFDTEFLEGPQDKTILGFKYGETKPTIDLISIGIVREDKTCDNREYYAISKDFNLKEAWNRYDLEVNKHYPLGPFENKVYWIRENVLKPMCIELMEMEIKDEDIWDDNIGLEIWRNTSTKQRYKNLKRLIAKYGKSNETIAQEVKEFCTTSTMDITEEEFKEGKEAVWTVNEPIFYAYFADYDWVVFCWIFGKMNDLPSGFPMYCKDLKQELDNKEEALKNKGGGVSISTLPSGVKGSGRTGTVCNYKSLLDIPSYPKQTNEHNALADARWNLELHKFIKSL
jgi:hypothetical protein